MNRSISRPRRAFGALFCASLVAIAVTGCGGGGDDGAAPSTPTAYPVAAAYSTYLTTAKTESFTSSGTIQGVGFTATGTTTQTATTNVTFEGKPAQTNTRTTNISAVAQGQSVPLTITAQQYFANGVLVGISAPGSYGVVTASALPASATVGASGTLYTTTIYESGSKLSKLGTTTVTYTLEADTASNSAVLRLSLTGTGVSGALDTKVRITSGGNASTLSEPVLISGTAATLTYQQ